LTRFPLSPDLHAWLRYQVLRDEGARALEAAYDEEPIASARATDDPSITWFHGLATFAAAEQDVANRDPDTALAAYGRAHERFARSVEAQPDFEASASHYRCLTYAGEARLLAKAGRFAEAVEAITQALRVAPASIQTADGLGKSPAESARELHRTLVRANELELARDVEARLTDAGLKLETSAEERPGG
jgi:tetratricopeptide (TPR) repeat protein